MSSRFVPPPECPVCGADVPRDARACPECGADERSGWNEDDARYDGLDLPDEAFGDDAPKKSTARGAFPPALWAVVAVLLVIALTTLLIFR